LKPALLSPDNKVLIDREGVKSPISSYFEKQRANRRFDSFSGHEPAIMYDPTRDSFEELNTYALGLKQADDVTLVVIKLEDLPANGEDWQMGSCEAD